MTDRLKDVSDELTPEQRLGSIIIQAYEGGYRNFVPAWAWDSHKKVNFAALQDAFDDYLKAKTEA